MKFAEFEASQIIDAATVSVSQQEIIEFARQFDPQWFHLDPSRAQASRFRLIAGYSPRAPP